MSVASQASASVGSRLTTARACRNTSWLVRASSSARAASVRCCAISAVRRAARASSHSPVTIAANAAMANTEPLIVAATSGRRRTNRCTCSRVPGLRTDTGSRCRCRRTSSPIAAAD